MSLEKMKVKEKKMTNKDKKVFGEDKLGKLVRLMGRYEGQLEEIDAVKVELQLNSDGSGSLMVNYYAVYNFVDTEGLFKFLEGGQLARTLMSRG